MPNSGTLPELLEKNEEYQRLFRELTDSEDFMSYYRGAVAELETRFRILNDYFARHMTDNPIVDIQTRLKTVPSIYEKLQRRGYPVSVQSVEDNLYDVAGIRVICPFIDDVYKVADQLLKQDDVLFVEKKDYIMFPKENGYRSLHLLIELPITLPPGRKMIKAEVQMRTIAMEFWANLEHKLRYKKDMNEELMQSTSEQLQECALFSNELDRRMQDIRYRIEGIPSADKDAKET